MPEHWQRMSDLPWQQVGKMFSHCQLLLPSFVEAVVFALDKLSTLGRYSQTSLLQHKTVAFFSIVSFIVTHDCDDESARARPRRLFNKLDRWPGPGAFWSPVALYRPC